MRRSGLSARSGWMPAAGEAYGLRMESTTPDARWDAVLRRDGQADGQFWYGVRTTGVYCRPTCPSRRPRREHVAFFASPDEAEAAGLRACLRCTPREVTAQQQAVARAQRVLDEPERAPGLAALGKAVGLSPSHLQRVFVRIVGVSPHRYAAARRAERVKAHLRGGAAVTDAMLDAGYGSSRALYESARGDLGMTPARYRSGGAGERIAYALTDTPLGLVLVAATAEGVCSVQFGDGRAALVAALRGEFPHAELHEDPESLAPILNGLGNALAGHAVEDVPLDARGTAFQQRVWAALRAIPTGETRTYAEVARAIGQPDAARAVAQACARNPVAVLVPCHRVVAAGEALGGYRWGVGRKRALLDAEAPVTV